MNPENASQEPAHQPLDEIKQKGREIGLTARMRAEDALAEAEYYVRRNPWIALGGAMLAGAAIVALMPRHRSSPPPGRMQAVREWLDEARASIAAQIPDRGDVRSAVKSTGLPGFLEDLSKKLRHI